MNNYAPCQVVHHGNSMSQHVQDKMNKPSADALQVSTLQVYAGTAAVQSVSSDTTLGKHWFIVLHKDMANRVAFRKMSERNYFWTSPTLLGSPTEAVAVAPGLSGDAFQWAKALQEKGMNFKEM
jgi:hypothetical protein